MLLRGRLNVLKHLYTGVIHLCLQPMPGQRSDKKVNVNAWVSKEAREVLDVLAKRSHRSRTQVVELLLLAEAKRHAENTDDPAIREDLFRLIDTFAEQAE